jgi:hypothetical protein
VAGATCGEKGRIAVATEDNAQTRAALTERDFTFDQHEITTVSLPHEPGSLAKAARQLANAGVNIESVMILGAHGQAVEVGFVTSDPASARNALAHAGTASG